MLAVGASVLDLGPLLDARETEKVAAVELGLPLLELLKAYVTLDGCRLALFWQLL